ncbi:amidohydrolase family protein [Egicoccus halophilus]|uniref:4-oxalomesaconate hydratase n=1 Tax=Egicoccus halophilus TaxID=1670830 RepID=A0A8J3AF17_9ACTN|nr:amidohydrolase family protein [Egicoccus halophilus]GGI07536.1 4-oxalomesaconate hydratase [Egicoccus halophilus]
MYNGKKVFDVHGHVSAPMGGVGRFNMVLQATNMVINNPMGDPTLAGVFGLEDDDWDTSVGNHLKVMDERDIDVQIIGPRPYLMFGWMQPHLLPVWTRFVNDSIAKQVGMFPERFLGACQLPQSITEPDATHMLDELNRCVDDFGFVAAYVSPDPTGRRDGPGLAESYWDPLYKRCVELNVPIIIHGTNVHDPRFALVPHNYQLGFVAEQYWANQVLSHSDVFERFPDLKVVICHCGGSLDRWIPTDPHLAQKDLSDNLFYDTCAHDVHYLEAAIKQRTVKRMLFGTEAPGSGKAIRPETGRSADDLVPVISAYDFLSEEDKLDIFHNNPAKIFPQFT